MAPLRQSSPRPLAVACEPGRIRKSTGKSSTLYAVSVVAPIANTLAKARLPLDRIQVVSPMLIVQLLRYKLGLRSCPELFRPHRRVRIGRRMGLTSLHELRLVWEPNLLLPYISTALLGGRLQTQKTLVENTSNARTHIFLKPSKRKTRLLLTWKR